MKKILLAALFVSFASCSSDSDSSTSSEVTPSGLKIKSITEVTYNGGTLDLTRTGNFVYVGDKLKSIDIITDNLKMDFLYTGDKISQVNSYFDNDPVVATMLTYDGTKLIRTANQEEKAEYTYVNGVLKSVTESTYTNNQWEFYEKKEYAFDQNNVTEIRASSKYATTVSKSKYIHDDKKNPFSGMNPYLGYLIHFESLHPLDQNNRLIQQRYASAASNDIVGTASYQIQYNSEGYPTEIRKVNDANMALLSKTVITYN